LAAQQKGSFGGLFYGMDMGQGRKFYDVVIVKASFDLKDGWPS
jgi:hypothetical protein